MPKLEVIQISDATIYRYVDILWHSYDNLAPSTQSLTHSQFQTRSEFQKTTIVESPIGMYNTYIAHLQ